MQQLLVSKEVANFWQAFIVNTFDTSKYTDEQITQYLNHINNKTIIFDDKFTAKMRTERATRLALQVLLSC